MTPEDRPVRRKKSAYIKRADVFTHDGAPSEEPNGECWVAVDDMADLIAVGTDIAKVTEAAKYAGFWVEDQRPDAA